MTLSRKREDELMEGCNEQDHRDDSCKPHPTPGLDDGFFGFCHSVADLGRLIGPALAVLFQNAKLCVGAFRAGFLVPGADVAGGVQIDEIGLVWAANDGRLGIENLDVARPLKIGRTPYFKKAVGCFGRNSGRGEQCCEQQDK